MKTSAAKKLVAKNFVIALFAGALSLGITATLRADFPADGPGKTPEEVREKLGAKFAFKDVKLFADKKSGAANKKAGQKDGLKSLKMAKESDKGAKILRKMEKDSN